MLLKIMIMWSGGMQPYKFMCMAATAIIMWATLSLKVDSFPVADKIDSLPGQPKVTFQQFSGYITVDDNQHRALFYYFAEAQTNPSSKPLLLWLNGGPGCSSVGEGAFIEHGPFRVSGQTLVKNYYSWNREANILYLESPAGVGFSYSANKSFYPTVNDKTTARDTLIFLRRWFGKFPEYNNRDLFIAGESYAGHYVPQLAKLIIDSKVEFNFKGIAIGNPLLEYNTDLNSEDEFKWSHGLISDSSYALLTRVCNSSRFRREYTSDTLTEECYGVYTHVLKETSRYVDQYDVTGDVCLSSLLSRNNIIYLPLTSTFHLVTSNPHSEKLYLNQQQVTGQSSFDVCAQRETTKYLNRKDVQQALHAKLVGVKGWSLCTTDLQYFVDQEIPTILVVGSLVKSGIRVLVYSGDQDSAIPFLGTRLLVNGLAKSLPLKTTEAYRAWLDQRKQIGGWTEIYGKNNILSFATIRGGSHTVPITQPDRSLLLFKSFLAGKPLPKA